MPWKKNQNKIFLPTTAVVEDGALVLSDFGKRRADHAAVAYFDQKCDRAKARIIVAGGYCKDLDFVPDTTEALLTADYLIKTHNIDPKTLLLEQRSKSTIENVAFSAIQYTKFFEGALNEEEKVVVVSHPYHLARVCFVMCRMGLPKTQLLKFPTTQLDDKDGEKEAFKKTKDELDEMEKRDELPVFLNHPPYVSYNERFIESE